MIHLPESANLDARALALAGELDAIEVRSAKSYEEAGERSIVAQNAVREVEGVFNQEVTLLIVPRSDEHFQVARMDGPLDAVAYRAHKDILAAKDAALAKPKSILARLKDKLTKWAIKEQQERQEREDKARREAARLAQEEADRKAAELREAAKLAAAEGDKRTAAAMKQEAKAIEAAPAPVPVVYVESKRPVLNGVAMRQTMDVQVVDEAAAIKHIAAHPELHALLKLDVPALKALARAHKGALSIPGVAVGTKTTAAVGCRQRSSDDQNGGHLPSME